MARYEMIGKNVRREVVLKPKWECKKVIQKEKAHFELRIFTWDLISSLEQVAGPVLDTIYYRGVLQHE